MAKKQTEFTPNDFAAKIGISRSTMWRWLNLKKYANYLKMHDAEVVEIAGKKFLKIK